MANIMENPLLINVRILGDETAGTGKGHIHSSNEYHPIHVPSRNEQFSLNITFYLLRKNIQTFSPLLMKIKSLKTAYSFCCVPITDFNTIQYLDRNLRDIPI